MYWGKLFLLSQKVWRVWDFAYFQAHKLPRYILDTISLRKAQDLWAEKYII